MLTSPGWRGRASQRAAIGVFTAGAAIGGLLSSVTLMAVGTVVAPLAVGLRIAVLLCVLVICVLRDLGLLRVALPENRRLIPQEVFLSHPWRGAARFGFELGTGVRTYIPSSAPYALAAALVLLAPGLTASGIAGMAFGLGRAALAWMRFAACDARAWDTRLDEVCEFPGLYGRRVL